MIGSRMFQNQAEPASAMTEYEREQLLGVSSIGETVENIWSASISPFGPVADSDRTTEQTGHGKSIRILSRVCRQSAAPDDKLQPKSHEPAGHHGRRAPLDAI
jgi:hypothetical protein